MDGVNDLIGPSTAMDDGDAEMAVTVADGTPRAVTMGNRDGSEIAVAGFVLGALFFLVLMRMGGFQTVIAASVSTAR